MTFRMPHVLKTPHDAHDPGNIRNAGMRVPLVTTKTPHVLKMPYDVQRPTYSIPPPTPNTPEKKRSIKPRAIRKIKKIHEAGAGTSGFVCFASS